MCLSPQRTAFLFSGYTGDAGNWKGRQRAIHASLAPGRRRAVRRKSMATIEKFNDHCWKDVVPESDQKLYAGWRRETFVGPRPALLAIDLYDLVYRGGPLPPAEINESYPNTCGVFAHRAIAPTKKLIAAARSAGIPIFFCTQETRPNNRPPGAVSTRRKVDVPVDGYAIYREFTVEPDDILITKQRA